MVQPHKGSGAAPAKILVPFLNPNDPRMFVRNGELIKPYYVVEFAFVRMDLAPELSHDRAFYRETGRIEFNPTGCVPISYFSIEKLEKDLNSALELLEKGIPDAPSNGEQAQSAA